MLSGDSPALYHYSQDATLLILSIAFLPITTSFVIVSYCINLFVKSSVFRNRDVARQDPHFRTKTILVTGVGMTKGLLIARLLFEAGHNVIGADFESNGCFVCGRVSKALKKFYPLQQPNSQTGITPYVDSLLNIIKKEHIDIWISCSGVASAVEDGLAKEIVESETSCKAVQFDADTTRILHEKHSFIEHTKQIGLTVPETCRVTSREEAEHFLQNVPSDRKYIMKPIGVDDSARGDMTLLPHSSSLETSRWLSHLNISKPNPWIVQQFIKGPEFCTHSLVVQGQVRAFVACRSAELLMHYEELSPQSRMSQEMLRFTQTYATSFGKSFTGHLSFDFLVEEKAMQSPENLVLYPIECNPRAHTAIVLFNHKTEMANKYLLAHEKADRRPEEAIISPEGSRKFYWLGHDLVTLVLLPMCSFLTLGMSLKDLLESYQLFVLHLMFWKDGAFEIWDPLPFWWLYQIYWPMRLLTCIRFGKKWSRLNVSTTKMFEC